MDARRKIGDALEDVARADADVVDTVAPYRKSPPVRALSIASEMGDQPQLRILSGMVIAAGLLLRNPRLGRAGVRMLAAHELATLAKDFVKNRVDRTRPRSARSIADKKMRAGRNPAKEESSFPSGHSAGALAVARGFSREYPDFKAPALAAAGVIAVAQVPRHAHYLTDVGAGLLVGAAAEALVDLAWRSVAGAAAPDNPLVANDSQLP